MSKREVPVNQMGAAGGTKMAAGQSMKRQCPQTLSQNPDKHIAMTCAWHWQREDSVKGSVQQNHAFVQRDLQMSNNESLHQRFTSNAKGRSIHEQVREHEAQEIDRHVNQYRKCTTQSGSGELKEEHRYNSGPRDM